MIRSKKISWAPGAIFGIPLVDDSIAIAQAVGLMMPNVVYCALSSLRFPKEHDTAPSLRSADIVSCVALTRHYLDNGRWRVLGNTKAVVRRSEFANERFSTKGYVGAEIYDAGLAESFLSAYHGLAPWDDWHDPHFLDEWLRSPRNRPKNLLFKEPQPPN